jgi:hypothetical protein
MAGWAPRVSIVAGEATGRGQLAKRSGLAEPAAS